MDKCLATDNHIPHIIHMLWKVTETHCIVYTLLSVFEGKCQMAKENMLIGVKKSFILIFIVQKSIQERFADTGTNNRRMCNAR